MSKKVTPFKMFFVTLPAIKPYTEKRVRAYVDLATGDVYGSEPIIARLFSNKTDIQDSMKVVETEAQTLINYYFKCSLYTASEPTARIRGKVTRCFDYSRDPSTLNVYNGAGSKLKFELI